MVLGRLRAMASGRGNYAYVTARVRARKTYLLPPDIYPKLLARDVHEIARTLQEGQYKEDIDALAGRHAGARLIELATRRNMAREYEDIVSWCQGELEHLVTHFLDRYTIYNAKAALRGVAAGASPEEIKETVVSAGMVPNDIFEEAINAPALLEASQALARAPQCAVLEGMEGATLKDMEDALDRAYYQHLLEMVRPTDRAKQAFHDFIRREIDIVNLEAILRLKASGESEYELIPGGQRINEAIARRLLNADPAEVRSIVDQTDYGDVLGEPLATWVETGDLNPAVTAIEQHHLAMAQEFSHLYPLSILPIVDYVLRKRVEVDNLRIIAVGKASGLDNDTIRSMVMA